MRQPEEQELIGRMQAGDSTAVTDLASTYGPRIHQLAFRYLKNWEDAEEVTHEVSRQEVLSTDAVDRPQPQEPADWSSLADDRVLRGEMRDQLIGALTHLPEVYRVP